MLDNGINIFFGMTYWLIISSRCIWHLHMIVFYLKATLFFVELTYTLATEEAERIGVDHVARMSTSDNNEASTGIGLLIYCYIIKECEFKLS